MEIKNLVEQVFAHAAALDQRGEMRNVIYTIKDEVFIMNYDNTLLLRFKLRLGEGKFDTPLSFYANDYESNNLDQKDGKIIFYTVVEGYRRKKICGMTSTPPDKIKSLFEECYQAKQASKVFEVKISDGLLRLLDEDLSHIEFSGKKDQSMKMIQRNIYSGSVIEVQKNQKGNGFFDKVEKSEYDLDPVSIRTKDLFGLFGFGIRMFKFSFLLSEGHNYIIIETMPNSRHRMIGIMSLCLYDETIEIQRSKKEDNGKQD